MTNDVQPIALWQPANLRPRQHVAEKVIKHPLLPPVISTRA